MINEITIEEMNALIENPKAGRFIAQQPGGKWQCLQIDFKGNVRQYASEYRSLAKRWLKL
ncbi:hypothetical protein NBRC110019_07720 [Neptunitalea chrysea]|uniref:Uncharacterized protein n=1 Tax=Neptunitalea chrysea TaxID=1647581 RepID=A0A9W6B6Q0_9FLAO|nr:hypothetical protein [Neptunitalea chrysea]GLB51733.1 hypothetical protein NBRC110019_07720 [Neptunitalea chrysea]